jgi:hypothetical protein
MSESLRNDGRIWVPATGGCKAIREGKKNQQNYLKKIDYYLESILLWEFVPRDVALVLQKKEVMLVLS